MSVQNTHYRRNLPHFHPDGHPLFITFRLVDSLPSDILANLKSQREQDLKALQSSSDEERYNAEKRYFGRYDDWLDRCEHGPQWLKQPEIASIVADKLHGMDKDRYYLLAYCIMPNHVHLLFEHVYIEQPGHHGKSAKYPITDTMRLIKGSSAHDCNLILRRNGKFWTHESYDHYVRNENELKRVAHYILNNPVKAGLVNKWMDWPHTYASLAIGSW